MEAPKWHFPNFTPENVIFTPYNVGSVLRRLFSTVGDSISTAEAVQYCGGIASVLLMNSISTAEAVQYCGGCCSTCGGIVSVLWRLFSTAEG